MKAGAPIPATVLRAMSRRPGRAGIAWPAGSIGRATSRTGAARGLLFFACSAFPFGGRVGSTGAGGNHPSSCASGGRRFSLASLVALLVRIVGRGAGTEKTDGGHPQLRRHLADRAYGIVRCGWRLVWPLFPKSKMPSLPAVLPVSTGRTVGSPAGSGTVKRFTIGPFPICSRARHRPEGTKHRRERSR